MGSYLSSNAIEYPITIRKKYGWIPDIPDPRDKFYDFRDGKSLSLSDKVDLRNEKQPEVYDQGSLGSCTANAICSAYMYDSDMRDFKCSRLFLYYNERVIENTVDYDAGASIRDGMKVINSIGVTPENDYPYLINHFTERPSDMAYSDAGKHKGITYERVNPNVNDFKVVLNSGFPVIFGFSVPSSFEELYISQTGVMKRPEPLESIIGGHAVVACGYDDNMTENGTTGYILVKNSWGQAWGQSG